MADVKIHNIQVHDKLELIQILRYDSGYTLENCIKFATLLAENESLTVDENIMRCIKNAESITFDLDRDTVYPADSDYHAAEVWYAHLLPEHQDFVRLLAKKFSSST